VNRRFPGRHRRVLLDTSVWICHFEQRDRFGRAATRVIDDLEAGRFEGVASELMLLELLVGPLRLDRQDVADEYELLLAHFPNFTLEPVTRSILLDAASLRARHRLPAPDAIHVATAIGCNATLMVTNDAAWRRVDGLEVALLGELA